MIDKNNPIPLYFQIKDDIFKDIESGKFMAGERLPAERLLAEKYGVTRMTIRQAIKLLVDQGFLQARQGSGTYIAERSPSANQSENKIIGVLLPDIQRGIMIDLIRGIEDEAHSRGYNTILCNTDNRWDKAEGYAGQLIANNVKGVIFVPIQDIENGARKEEKNRDLIDKFMNRGTPIVLVDHECKIKSTDIVVSDNFAGGYELTRYLIDMGHRRIAIVYDFEETSISDRIAGYQKALRDYNIEFDPRLIQKIKEYGFTESFSELIKTIIHNIKATALFAMNDLLAADVYYHADKLKLHIPRDISVVGYDDLPFAERLRTPLTTIHQPLYQMGRESFYLLFERLQKPQGQFKKVILPNRLVTRKSVKKI
ncbi:GntR family transcriptional regulator [candidate division KSB1 bacterium]|nr:GntR family transcriptional regulator [candidate division KSB1 bacterium]